MPPGILVLLLFAVLALLALRQWARVGGLGGVNLRDLDAMSGTEFEAWVAQRFHAAGWNVTRRGGPGDFGSDLIVVKGRQVLSVQIKRSSAPVGNRAVQQASAGAEFFQCQGAVVVTQSRFTSAAREQAGRSLLPVVLIDRNGLAAMTRMLETLAITEIDEEGGLRC